jgi:hypothetical protein
MLNNLALSFMGPMKVRRRFQATGNRIIRVHCQWFPLIYKSFPPSFPLAAPLCGTAGDKQKKA